MANEVVVVTGASAGVGRATARGTDGIGLLAEQADEHTGELWGNLPQAFSHVGLINAAWCLSQTGVE